jgi:general secretion pathway protein L
MATEQASAEFEDARAAASFLLRHWRDELASLATGVFGRFLPQAQPALVVAARADEVVLGHDEGGNFGTLARIGRGADTPPALGAVLTRFGLVGTDVILRVPGIDVLRPTLQLPNGRANAIAGALRYELERLTPLDPDELYFDYAVTARDRASNTAHIQLRIIRKDIVDAAVALCRASGLQVAAIGFEGDARNASWRQFPVDRAAHVRNLWRAHGNAALAGLAIAFFALLLFAAYARGSAEIDALNDQTADEGQNAARVERIAREIATTRREFAALAREKSQPLAVAVLADLTRVLPDGTWLSEIQIDGRTVRIQGNSPSASELIGRIDSSGRFANAQFEAPVVQDAALHADHFSMVLDVVGGAP